MNLISIIKAVEVFKPHVDKKISPVLAYKIMKFMKAAETEVAFYDKSLLEITEKYGERDECGELKTENNRVFIKEDAIEECNEKVQELQAMEVELSPIKFTLEELAQLEFSVKEMLLLDELILVGG